MLDGTEGRRYLINDIVAGENNLGGIIVGLGSQFDLLSQECGRASRAEAAPTLGLKLMMWHISRGRGVSP